MDLLPIAPRDIVRTAAEIARWSVDTTAFVAGLPLRLNALLDQVELLMARVEDVTEGAAVVVARAEAVTDGAELVVTTAGRTSDSAQNLLSVYEPMALHAAPLAQTFLDDLGEEEIHAAIGLVNHLPELTARLTALMPILATLDTVSPEIHELLDVVKDVRQAIQGVPGFKFFRKRGESQEDE
ncbi:MAG: ribulose 1,5-bisphosphate carboxylase large subunit [Rhodococcus sp.]|nr:ribulose 1,5-bisphosphate carboxylase large subunit [Rhodococcus sp. (in: high G+C Gram-positive bacteria)]